MEESLASKQPNVEEKGKARGKGKAGNNHVWSAQEDAALVEAMMDLFENRPDLKGEKGFRGNYHSYLEKKVEEKIPGCEIQGHPHIESRYKWFKSKYMTIYDMLQIGSGFGWDDEEKCIKAPRDVFDDYVKNGHKESAGLLNKPFPHYEALAVLFGKDRATGLGAETAQDVLEAEASSKKEQSVNLIEGGSDNEETSVKQPQSSKKRSRSEDESIATLVEKVSDFCGDYRASMEHLKDISCYFKQEAETNERRGKLFEEIMKIDGLTPNDMLDAGEYIAKDVGNVNFFLGLPTAFRQLYVLKQLAERNGSA